MLNFRKVHLSQEKQEETGFTKYNWNLQISHISNYWSVDHQIFNRSWGSEETGSIMMSILIIIIMSIPMIILVVVIIVISVRPYQSTLKEKGGHFWQKQQIPFSANQRRSRVREFLSNNKPIALFKIFLFFTNQRGRRWKKS